MSKQVTHGNEDQEMSVHIKYEPLQALTCSDFTHHWCTNIVCMQAALQGLDVHYMMRSQDQIDMH